MSMTHDQRGRWVRMVLRSELPASQRMVLFALETFADWGGGGNAHPGEILLAETAGVDVRTVRRAIAAGVKLGLIEQTRPANPKAHKAAVYRIVVPPVLAAVEPVSTGHHGPVETSTTGHHGPVNNVSTGQASPVLPDTGVLSPKPLTNNQRVLRNSGTSPETESVVAHTEIAPSRFCDEHPLGTRDDCPRCGNARTHRKAWLEAQAERDAAIELAEAANRKVRRQLIDECPICDDFGRLDDLNPCHHGQPPDELPAVGNG